MSETKTVTHTVSTTSGPSGEEVLTVPSDVSQARIYYMKVANTGSAARTLHVYQDSTNSFNDVTIIPSESTDDFGGSEDDALYVLTGGDTLNVWCEEATGEVEVTFGLRV